MWIYAIVPAFLGLAAVWIAVGWWRIRRWPEANGTVRSIVPAETTEGWIVTFAFEEAGGWTSEAKLTVEDRRGFELGQRLALRRNPMNPGEIETFHPRRMAVVIAVLLMVAGLWTAAMIHG